MVLATNPCYAITEEELPEEALNAIAGGNWNINNNHFKDEKS